MIPLIEPGEYFKAQGLGALNASCDLKKTTTKQITSPFEHVVSRSRACV